MLVNRTQDFERIKNAQNARKIQLKNWEVYDQNYLENNSSSPHPSTVEFPKDVIFMESALRNDLVETKRLLEEGIDPNTKNIDGLTVLHQACINNNYGIAKILLSYNADVNATDAELWTPLHAAAACGFVKICKLLISNGANLLAMNIDGNMPYDICDDEKALDLIESEMGSRNITQEQIDEIRKFPETTMFDDMVNLFKANKDLNQLDERGAAPLHIAASLGYEQVTKMLLQCGADPNVRDTSESTAAHIATVWSHWEVLELLVMFGADLEIENSDGKTVFSMCEDSDTVDKIRNLWARRAQLREYSKRLDDFGFKRTRSTNNRRSLSSVKRSSVKQKSNMSRREAKEEALLNPSNFKQDSLNEPDSVPHDLTNLNSPNASDMAVYSASEQNPTLHTDDSSKKVHDFRRQNKVGSKMSIQNENIYHPPKTQLISSSPESPSSPISVETFNKTNNIRIPVMVDLNSIRIPSPRLDMHGDTIYKFRGDPETLNTSNMNQNPDAFERTLGREKIKQIKKCCCLI